MKTINFEIIRNKKIPINISLESSRFFPVTEHYLFKQEIFIITYQFKPTKKLNEEKYINFLISFLKKEHNAIKVKIV